MVTVCIDGDCVALVLSEVNELFLLLHFQYRLRTDFMSGFTL